MALLMRAVQGAALSLAVACAPGRTVVQVPVAFAPSSPDVVPGDGVSIALDDASVTVAHLRLESPPDPTARWRLPSLISTAVAHPGHDFAGGVSGELLGTWTLDLLGDPVPLGSATLQDGAYATARLQVEASPVLTMSGTATVDGDPIPFGLEAAIAQEITGIPFDLTLDPETPPEALTLSVDLDHALSFVDWRTDPGADGLLTIDDGAVGHTLTFGVVSTPTWTLEPVE